MRWLDELVQDIRYAVRSLLRSPGYSLSATVVLALGIGATTAVFSAVDAVLLDDAYDDVIRVYQPNARSIQWQLSTVELRAIEREQRSFAVVGALARREAGVSAGAEPVQVQAGPATAGFFVALRVQPAYGRSIRPDDERVGAPPVTLVSYTFAERRLGGAANAVGRSINFDGLAHTVVGVLPPRMRELAGWRAEVWPALQLPAPTRRGPFQFLLLSRLADGVTMDAAARDLAGISDRLFPLWAVSFQDRSARLTPLPFRTAMLGGAGRMLRIFAVAAALVLCIAVANVASLTLVRAAGRRREVSLRTVLGATRARLLRLLVTESVVLATVGAAAGVLLATVGLRLLIAVGPAMPRLHEARLDLRAVAFAVGAAFLAGAIVGAYPVALLFRRDPAPDLRDGSRTASAGRRTQGLRGLFVAAEFALALPLLVGAGLLLNSFLRLQQVSPGFDARPVLTVRVALPSARYAADSTVAAFWSRALPLVREIPGVTAAAAGTAMPPDVYGASDNNFDLVDRPVPGGAGQPMAPWPFITADYFAALDVPLLDGRRFGVGDSAGAPPVVIVSRAWARRHFPNGTVLGRQLIAAGCITCPRTTVVGVVENVKYAGLGGAGDAVYAPLAQGWSRDVTLFVRATGAPAEIADRVRAALRSVEPNVPLDDVAPMTDRLYDSIAQPRHWTTLLGSFAAAALALAAVGIFGMLSYTVSARRREIGVRMAVGAGRGAVVAMIVRRGMAYAAVGAAVGLVAALAGTRWLASALYGVGATDLPTLAAVTLLLLGVALVACWLPARRAASIDPAEAIRVE